MTSVAPAASASTPPPLPPGSNPPVADDTPIQLHPLVVVNISDHITRLATLTAVAAAGGGGDSRSFGGGTGVGGASSRARDGRSSSGGPAAAAATGAAAGGGGTDGTRAYGVLLGRQPGRVVEVCHSFEVPMIAETGGPGGGVAGRQTLDPVFLAGRIEQYKQDVMLRLHESPILMVVNPRAAMPRAAGSPPLPPMPTSLFPIPTKAGRVPVITFFETALIPHEAAAAAAAAVAAAGGASGPPMPPPPRPPPSSTPTTSPTTRLVLLPVAHAFISAEAERIAVEHVRQAATPVTAGGGGGVAAATSGDGSGGSASANGGGMGGQGGVGVPPSAATGVAAHLATLHTAAGRLDDKVRVVGAYLAAVEAGTIAVDGSSAEGELLRRVGAVAARLVSAEGVGGGGVRGGAGAELGDGRVVTYLAGVTKGIGLMSEVVDAFRGGYMGGRGRGGGGSGKLPQYDSPGLRGEDGDWKSGSGGLPPNYGSGGWRGAE